MGGVEATWEEPLSFVPLNCLPVGDNGIHSLGINFYSMTRMNSVKITLDEISRMNSAHAKKGANPSMPFIVIVMSVNGVTMGDGVLMCEGKAMVFDAALS